MSDGERDDYGADGDDFGDDLDYEDAEFMDLEGEIEVLDDEEEGEDHHGGDGFRNKRGY